MPLGSDLEQQFIARLAQAAIDGPLPAEFSEDDAREVMTGFVGPAAVAALLTELFVQNLIRQTSTDPVKFEIKMKLLRKAEEIGTTTEAKKVIEANADVKSSDQGRGATSRRYPTIDDVPDFDSLGDVDELTEPRQLGDIGVPASDRYVELSHNNPEYKDAINTLDKLIQEFREDHHLDNELGREKPALLRVLEGGRELLDDTRVRVHAVLTLIIAPLRIIAAKYDESIVAGTVGALATAAIAAIAKLIGVG